VDQIGLMSETVTPLRYARRAARESDGLNGFVPGVALADSGNRRAEFCDAFSVVVMRRSARKEVAAGFEIRDFRFQRRALRKGFVSNAVSRVVSDLEAP